ncbi:MAG: TlpA family protein disulfide reductase [Ignavibacteriales bacterium]|nr:TlpA family protein disulfide reductase [Ignavibacteriales bacterium]
MLSALCSTLSAQEKIDFSVTTLSDEEIQLSQLYAKGPTLVTFWALWCEPCKSEMRSLQSLFEKYSEQGFSLLTINEDSPKSAAKVSSYIASQNYSFPVVLDPNGELLQLVNGQSVPFAILFDTGGKIVHQRIGYLHGDEKELEKEIVKLISKTE